MAAMQRTTWMAWALALCFWLAPAGCGAEEQSESPLDVAAATESPPDPGELVIVEPGGETICSRGTPYRFFAVGGHTDRLVLDMEGGGACWNEATCSIAEAIFRPEAPTAEEFQEYFDGGHAAGIYRLDDERNPFQGWSLVHVPYCTGDIHWGNATHTYNEDLVVHHRGFVNAMAALDWVTSRYVGLEHVVVTGCSAGSYGAIGVAAYVAQAYPEARITVLGDSGAGVITETFFEDSFPNWNAEPALPTWLPGLEGMALADLTIVDLYAAIANGYPDMRVAQYNTAYDADQVFYYEVMGGMAGAWRDLMETSLAAITDRAPAFRSYTAPGPIHCIHPYDFFYDREVGGALYTDWLAALIFDDTRPDTVSCKGDDCLHDALCNACADGTSTDSGCGWCKSWDPAVR